MGRYQGTCPLYRKSRRASGPKPPAAKRQRRPKLWRLEGAIRWTADSFITNINAEIVDALEAKRTGPERKRLLAIRRACERLRTRTLDLLYVLHGLEKPGKTPDPKRPSPPQDPPE